MKKNLLLFCGCSLLTACNANHSGEGTIGDPYSLVLIPQADGENIRYRYDEDGSCNLQLQSMRSDSPGLTQSQLNREPVAHWSSAARLRHSATV